MNFILQKQADRKLAQAGGLPGSEAAQAEGFWQMKEREHGGQSGGGGLIRKGVEGGLTLVFYTESNTIWKLRPIKANKRRGLEESAMIMTIIQREAI